MKTLFILFLFTSTALASVPDSSCTSLKNSFDQHFRKGNTSAAVDIFRQILATCPTHERALMQRGIKVFLTLCADTQNVNQKNCRDTVIMIRKQLHQTQPSGNSAMELADSYSEAGMNREAGRYYREAMDLESDPLVKAEICMAMARHTAYKLNDFENARVHARRALVFNPLSGKPHLFTGKLYAASADSCKMSIFKDRTVYWAAVDALEMARTDSTTKEEADSLIATYSKLFPSQEEVKKAGKKPGDKFTDNCWIGGTTIIRTR